MHRCSIGWVCYSPFTAEPVPILPRYAIMCSWNQGLTLRSTSFFSSLNQLVGFESFAVHQIKNPAK